MALTIYGSPRSRTMRVLWMAAELGLDYELVPIAFEDPILKTPAFLRLNLAGTIPSIVDDGFAMWESLAINLYLAKKNGRLYPAALQGEALVWRWSLWAMQHIEPLVEAIRRHRFLLPEPERVEALAGDAERRLRPSLAVLDAALADNGHLVGAAFTVADLNVAGVLSPSRTAHLDLEPHPRIVDWLGRCYGRPAAVEARARAALVADVPGHLTRLAIA